MSVCNIVGELPPFSPVTNTGVGCLVRAHTYTHTQARTHMQMPLKLKLEASFLEWKNCRFSVFVCVCLWVLKHVYCLCFTSGESHYVTKCDSHLCQKNEKGFVAGVDGNK